MTGLFENVSRRQGVLHQQSCVGHYWFWLGQQVLGGLRHSWVTHSTKADLRENTHTSLFSSATTWASVAVCISNPLPHSSLSKPCLVSSLIKMFTSEMTFPEEMHATSSKRMNTVVCSLQRQAFFLLVRDLSFLSTSHRTKCPPHSFPFLPSQSTLQLTTFKSTLFNPRKNPNCLSVNLQEYSH